MSHEVRLVPLPGIPEVTRDADLAALLLAAAERAGVSLGNGALVVCQKIISKAEGRIVDLSQVDPSEEACRIAAEDDKDPRHIEVVLRESARLVRHGHGIMICETHHGYICANAGVDLSNAPGPEVAVLLPHDSDASAAKLRAELVKRGAGPLAIVVSDTFGRPWREGLVDVALGASGIDPIKDRRGSLDRSGRELQVTATATADQLAAAAGLLMPKDSGVPAVWVEGVPIEGDGRVADTLRNPDDDLFR